MAPSIQLLKYFKQVDCGCSSGIRFRLAISWQCTTRPLPFLFGTLVLSLDAIDLISFLCLIYNRLSLRQITLRKRAWSPARSLRHDRYAQVCRCSLALGIPLTSAAPIRREMFTPWRFLGIWLLISCYLFDITSGNMTVMWNSMSVKCRCFRHAFQWRVNKHQTQTLQSSGQGTQ